jgi:hypothetical protein
VVWMSVAGGDFAAKASHPTFRQLRLNHVRFQDVQIPVLSPFDWLGNFCSRLFRRTLIWRELPRFVVQQPHIHCPANTSRAKMTNISVYCCRTEQETTSHARDRFYSSHVCQLTCPRALPIPAAVVKSKILCSHLVSTRTCPVCIL